MPKLVKFNGPEDIRSLSTADLEKAGVKDFKGHDFVKGEPVELNNDIVEALVQDVRMGNFEEVDEAELKKIQKPGIIKAEDPEAADLGVETDPGGVAATGVSSSDASGSTSTAGTGSTTGGSTARSPK
jgi:hypothetical protein